MNECKKFMSVERNFSRFYIDNIYESLLDIYV